MWAQWRGITCGDVHAVIYMQCRGEWRGGWAGELPLAPTLRVRVLAGGDEKGRPGGVALIFAMRFILEVDELLAVLDKDFTLGVLINDLTLEVVNGSVFIFYSTDSDVVDTCGITTESDSL